MTTAAPIIRDARAADRPSLIEFNRLLALETEAKALDEAVLGSGVDKALADPDRLRYWVAELGGRIIGQAAVSREWSDWRDGWIWWFQSVYVDAECRRLGVFRGLYSHIRDAALAEPDVIGLRLYVEEANERAQGTYRSLGMKAGGYHVYEELWVERFNRPPG